MTRYPEQSPTQVYNNRLFWTWIILWLPMVFATGIGTAIVFRLSGFTGDTPGKVFPWIMWVLPTAFVVYRITDRWKS